MSCWVTPEIAADWWSISLDAVLRGVQGGTIASKQDIGRLFVDVAPNSPQIAAAQADIEDDVEVGADFGDWKIGREQSSQQRRKLAA